MTEFTKYDYFVMTKSSHVVYTDKFECNTTYSFILQLQKFASLVKSLFKL